MKLKGCSLFFVFIILLAFTGNAVPAQKRPATVAEIALYNGPDRQQILEEGARKEGKLTFYTVHILNGPLVEAFQKKYPFIKVQTWRGNTNTILPKLLEEYKSGKQLADVVEGVQLTMTIPQKMGMLQPFYSPNIAYLQDDAVIRAPGEGAFRVAMWESGVILAYNTKLITREEVPKNFQDLLSPRWKGKAAIANGAASNNWMGSMLANNGEDFVRQMAKQNFDIHLVSARAVLDMIINGEYAFSPAMYDSQVQLSRKKGAPVDFVPLEPVPVTLGQIALPKNSSSPNAAMLFIDFELSKESAEMQKLNGYSHTRKDVTGGKTYKKFYGANSVEEEVKWQDLFNKLFLKK